MGCEPVTKFNTKHSTHQNEDATPPSHPVIGADHPRSTSRGVSSDIQPSIQVALVSVMKDPARYRGEVSLFFNLGLGVGTWTHSGACMHVTLEVRASVVPPLYFNFNPPPSFQLPQLVFFTEGSYCICTFQKLNCCLCIHARPRFFTYSLFFGHRACSTSQFNLGAQHPTAHLGTVNSTGIWFIKPGHLA